MPICPALVLLLCVRRRVFFARMNEKNVWAFFFSPKPFFSAKTFFSAKNGRGVALGFAPSPRGFFGSSFFMSALSEKGGSRHVCG